MIVWAAADMDQTKTRPNANVRADHFGSRDQNRAIGVLDAYVRVWLDRVEPVESLLKDPIVFRATTGKRQQQYGNNLPKLRRLSER